VFLFFLVLVFVCSGFLWCVILFFLCSYVYFFCFFFFFFFVFLFLLVFYFVFETSLATEPVCHFPCLITRFLFFLF